MYNTQQGIGATDHLSFLRAGVPEYQAIHDYTNYDVRTHHTKMDTLHHLGRRTLIQMCRSHFWETPSTTLLDRTIWAKTHE